MNSVVRRIVGIIQIGGGFTGAVAAVRELAGNSTITVDAAFIITCVFLLAFLLLILAGMWLLENNSHGTKLSLWLQAFQIPWFSSPFFTYKFFAGFHFTLFWLGNQSGMEYWVGSRWALLFDGGSTWGVGLNVFALVVFIILYRSRGK